VLFFGGGCRFPADLIFPLGKGTLLQGDPGDGKSKLMLSLATLLSKGAPLPFADEDESCESMDCT